MNKVHFRVDSQTNDKYRITGLTLFKAAERQRIKLGKKIFQLRQHINGVTIVARSTSYIAGNLVRIYGGVDQTILIAFYDPQCGPIFWDFNGAITGERFAKADPYASESTENINIGGAFPNILPMPDVDLGRTVSLTGRMFSNRPSVDDWIRAYLHVDGVQVWNDILWYDDVTPNTFGSGWDGEWVINSRPYAESAILGYNGLANGYQRHGIIGNWLVGEKVYIILYETTSTGKYFYLLAISIADGTEGDLLEDYLLSTPSSTLNSFSANILQTGTANLNHTLYLLSNADDTLYKFTVDPGVGVTENTYSYGTDTLEHICCTENYIYWMTKTGGWTSKIYRSTHADPSTSTLILTVVTDATWIFANMATFSIAVDPTDSKLFFQYKEASNPADSNSVKGVLEVYDLTVLPSTPTLEFTSNTLLDERVIGLKYK